MKLIIDIDDELYKQITNDSRVYVIDDINSIFVENAVYNGTPLDSIISQIEQARNKDKIAEYPYNRCIEILRRAMK